MTSTCILVTMQSPGSSQTPKHGLPRKGRSIQSYAGLFVCMFMSLYAAGIYFHFDFHSPAPSVSAAQIKAVAAAQSNVLVTPPLTGTTASAGESESGAAKLKSYEKQVKELHDETARLERQIQDLTHHLSVDAAQALKGGSSAAGGAAAQGKQAVGEREVEKKSPGSKSNTAAAAEKAATARAAQAQGQGQGQGQGSPDKELRKHMVLESSDASTQGLAPIRAMMVVCGTDGSGTRKVVQVLADMGVLVVSEDPETYDIHGDLMGGWPTVVKPVVQNVKTLNYWPEDAAGENNKQGPQGTTLAELAERKRRRNILPVNVDQAVGGSLRRLVDQARRDSHKPQSFVLAKGGALPRPHGSDAARVSFAFKAPVAMTLTPYWAHLEPHFKLLHVLRDGRDISFSANQSPVQKFYTDMYGRDAKDPRIKAIRLWSDWNSQVYAWASEYTRRLRAMYGGGGFGSGAVDAGSTSSGSGGGERPDKSFSYMAFHSEDLVSENVANRCACVCMCVRVCACIGRGGVLNVFEYPFSFSDPPPFSFRYRAICSLAAWVGSTLSPQRLCCIAQSSAHFMGSHDRTSRESVRAQTRGNEQKELSKRYGKWHAQVKQNPELGKALDAAGREGLGLFGYEPQQELLYPQSKDVAACEEPTQESLRKCSASG